MIKRQTAVAFALVTASATAMASAFGVGGVVHDFALARVR